MTDDLYIGLMSGTSLDGIDAVLTRFNDNQPEVIASHCLPLPVDLKDEIKSLISPTSNEINRLMTLDVQLGQYFAEAVTQLLKNAHITKEHVIAIGSHGQTIRHFPDTEYLTSLQISDPNIIAEKTGITTVADFRRRDMAAGGQGAPLVPAFHEHIFRNANKNRVILNLGGIANITLLPADTNIPVTGFDTGPANTLINHWIQQQQNKSFDKNGEWASSGEISESFINELLNDNYFSLAPPKSTGTEYFNPEWLSRKIALFPFLSAEDIQASLTTFTAKSVSNAIHQYAINTTGVDEIIICGGGVHNDFLLKKLADYLPEISINSSAVYGLDPDYIEATAFAWLAKQTLERKPGNLPDVTGAINKVILGGIYWA